MHKRIPELFIFTDQVNGFYLSLARKWRDRITSTLGMDTY